jgi:ABC-2 type transport system ATP-binding protein
VLLREFSENPRTIIVSSHLLSEIEGILSEIILIDDGKLVLYEDIDELRQRAYRIEGEESAVNSFADNKNVIYKKSGLASETVIYEELTEEVKRRATELGLTVSTVRAEDLCVYLTRENKGGELECLWQKMN